MSTVEQKPTIELLDDGDVVFNNKRGRPTKIGTFDNDTGHLEFESEEKDKMHRELTIRYIQFEQDGQTPTNMQIKSFGIKGRARDVEADNIPPMPKSKDGLGDKSPKVVEWFFKWKPQEAYARYGVRLDKSGNPILAKVKRFVKTWGEVYVDDKGRPLQEPTQGEIVTDASREEGMIARRATHMTYLIEEVVGDLPEE